MNFLFFFYHTENNTQPALIILCRVCSLVNISGGISTPEWEALDTGKKTQAIPISGPITTDPLCAKKNTKGTKERTLCFRVVHSWAVCLSLSCPLKKCQEALCAGWWRHLVCLFFSPLTRENPFFIIMHLPFQHPLALTCQFKHTSIPLLVAPFPLHCNFAHSHMCWLESCY